MSRYLTCLATLGLMIASGGTTRANLITNGSFELGTNPGVFTTLGTGSTAITDWVVSSGSVDYIGSYWQAADGSRSIDLDGNAQGGLSLSQSFATTIGSTYLVTFSMAGNPDGDPTVKSLSAYASSTNPVATSPAPPPFTFDTTGKSETNMGWLLKSFTFVATGTQSTLTFSSLDAGSYGAALDNVNVSAVPEPVTLVMSGTAGLIGLGVARIRRRNLAVSA